MQEARLRLLTLPLGSDHGAALQEAVECGSSPHCRASRRVLVQGEDRRRSVPISRDAEEQDHNPSQTCRRFQIPGVNR